MTESMLIEGRKRQIRRSMEQLGCRVSRLVRVAMGPLELGDLARGKARPLSKGERTALLKFVSQAQLERRFRRS